MKFEPLVEHLEANIDALVRGKTLFVNQMPAEIVLGLLLKDSFAGTQIDGEISPLRKGRFQIAARGKEYVQVKELVEAAVSALTISDHLFDGILVHSIRPLHEPIPYQTSVGGNVEFSVNFSAIYVIVQ